MFKILSFGQGYVYSNYKKFLCDSEDDVSSLPTDVAIGSVAFVIATKNIYIFACNSEWTFLKTAGSSEALESLAEIVEQLQTDKIGYSDTARGVEFQVHLMTAAVTCNLSSVALDTILSLQPRSIFYERHGMNTYVYYHTHTVSTQTPKYYFESVQPDMIRHIVLSGTSTLTGTLTIEQKEPTVLEFEYDNSTMTWIPQFSHGAWVGAFTAWAQRGTRMVAHLTGTRFTGGRYEPGGAIELTHFDSVEHDQEFVFSDTISVGSDDPEERGECKRYAFELHFSMEGNIEEGTLLPGTLESYELASVGDIPTNIPTTPADIGAAPAVTEVTISTNGAVTQALDAGKIYHFTGSLTSLTLTLNAAPTGQLAQYHFDFSEGSTAFDPTLPSAVIWPNGSNQTWEADYHYEVDILNNYAVVAAWES